MDKKRAGVSQLQSIDKLFFSPRLEKEFVYGQITVSCYLFVLIS